MFWNIQVVDLLKLALVSSMIILGTWYAFHTIAGKEWRHNFVTITTCPLNTTSLKLTGLSNTGVT